MYFSVIFIEDIRSCYARTPSAGAHKTRGYRKIWRFSTEIAVYLGNGTR